MVPILRNKKSVLLLWVMCFMTLTPVAGWGKDVWDGSRGSDFTAEGDGTALTPYLIRTGSQLANLCDRVNSGDHDSRNLYYALMDDIDLDIHEWTPIGKYQNYFFGTFNGNGKIISNVTVEGKGSSIFSAAGLFGITNGGVIENLGVTIGKDGISSESSYAGGVVASTVGGTIIRSCQVEGSGVIASQGLIKSSRGSGGIVGGITGPEVVEDCYSDCAIEGDAAGGIVGEISGNGGGKITRCYARGIIKATTDGGGIVGRSYASATLSACLGLNRSVDGANKAGRIIGDKGPVTLLGNCGSANMPVNGAEVNGAVDDEQGETLNEENFIGTNDMAFAGWDDASTAWTFYSKEVLPQLKNFDPQSFTPRSYFVKAVTKYNVQIEVPANGRITGEYIYKGVRTSVSGGNIYSIPEGATLTLNATPSEGFEFKHFYEVSYGSEYTDNPLVLTVTKEGTYTAIFEKATPPVPPTVWYNVRVPASKGVLFTCQNQVADSINLDVLDRGSLTFYIKLKPDYIASGLKVTTNRGEVLLPRDSDNKYIVSDISENVEVKVEGVHPTGNEAINADQVKVWTSNGELHIQAPAQEKVHIVTFAGALLKQLTTTGGHTTVSLAPGSYIVRVGQQSFKVNL